MSVYCTRTNTSFCVLHLSQRAKLSILIYRRISYFEKSVKRYSIYPSKASRNFQFDFLLKNRYRWLLILRLKLINLSRVYCHFMLRSNFLFSVKISPPSNPFTYLWLSCNRIKGKRNVSPKDHAV